MAFKTMKEVRKYLDEVHRKLQEVPDGNFFKLADKLGLDVLRDFAKSDLRNTDLSNGNLENADLSYTNLSHADLSGANLKNANLGQAILLKANLSRADLSGADLSNAILQNTDLNEVSSDSNTKFPEGFNLPKQSNISQGQSQPSTVFWGEKTVWGKQPDINLEQSQPSLDKPDSGLWRNHQIAVPNKTTFLNDRDNKKWGFEQSEDQIYGQSSDDVLFGLRSGNYTLDITPDMPTHNELRQLKQKIGNLMVQGQDFDHSFDLVLQDYAISADRADEILRLKQQLERDIQNDQ